MKVSQSPEIKKEDNSVPYRSSLLRGEYFSHQSGIHDNTTYGTQNAFKLLGLWTDFKKTFFRASSSCTCAL